MQYDAYYNGKFCKRADVSIPLTDRSIFFADGVYDAAIGRFGKIFLLEDHINRLFSNAKRLSIPIPMNKTQMEEVLTSLVKDCPFDEYFVYFQLSRYSEERCHAYPDTEKSNFLATVSKIELKPPTYRLKLISTPDIRYEMCDVKTLNLLPSVLASKRASDLGADEAVFYRGNIVTECAHSNIHIVKNGVIRTHPLDNHILPGISRKHMINTAHRLGIKVIEEAFSLEELKKADEVIITSSSKLALRASELDEIRYDTEIFVIGKAICSAMRDDFEAFCSSLP